MRHEIIHSCGCITKRHHLLRKNGCIKIQHRPPAKFPNRFEDRGSYHVMIVFSRDTGEELEVLLDSVDARRLLSLGLTWAAKKNDGHNRVTTERGRKFLSLHRFIIDAPAKTPVDHKDGNDLNHRRDNLRVVSYEINALNRNRAQSISQSGIRGIAYCNGKWVAKLRGRRLGTFADVRDAAHAIWIALLEIDEVSAASYLRSLPGTAPASVARPVLVRRTA